ncbi:MAG: hypothetical protein P4L10_01555 [Acidobacteriaceae bacterium]|nr:hypothetical protein [Acidobacteriaceae bacterium]
MTDEEVRAFLSRYERSQGIKVKGRDDLYFEDDTANGLELKFPETPLSAPYFARLVSMLGTDGDEGMFYGATLWITLHDIGSPQLEKAGWMQVELMRRGFGENRPIDVASGHWFRNGEVVELAAFVLPCFVFGWDAYIIPSGGKLFIHISHDEYWAVIARDEETFEKCHQALLELNPLMGNQALLSRFCPNSKLLKAVG